MENEDARFWILLAKKLANEATIAELAELKDMLARADMPAMDEELLSTLWTKRLENQATPDLNIDANWKTMSQSIFPEKSHLYVTTVTKDKNTIPKRTRRWLYAAASVMILVVSVLGIRYVSSTSGFFPAKKETDFVNQVSSRNGAKTSVLLPEGTKVWLNAGSNIYYKNNFLSRREVYLVGEAYFDVVHNEEKPFVIHAANVNIRVLGTAFNVKAYPGEDRVETALIRGSVELSTNDDPERKILLRPNEKIAILKTNAHTGLLTKAAPGVKGLKKEELYNITLMQVNKTDSSLDEIAWMQEKLIFNAETFGSLATQMERWYGVDINFQNEALTKIKFSGVFDNQNVVEALDALAYSSNFQFTYSINKSQVIIQPK
ncbi:MAG: FecR family protein [Gloeobacteraceae cyanobacterium ES-bin-316]|nr:FecR family protein [Ferruginibacter sp.]